ncbi:hypothetical protein J2Z70_002720 [Paenibacillus silagei]|uniref:Uncharacterized protein n=1 Tax=Paenibacillus silagei TaxID=1670801 RepID=A0ABS4NSX2_9BACL|nr:hypothetical protein [Paenibacillus silagei]
MDCYGMPSSPRFLLKNNLLNLGGNVNGFSLKAMPLIQGVLITEYSPEILPTINQLTKQLGTYYAWWE